MKQILFPSHIPQPLRYGWFYELDRTLRKFFGEQKIISVACVNAREMQRLNFVYRGKNKATDILSFRLDAPDGASDLLGELIVCIPMLRKHAREKKRTLNREFQMMIIHGTLHIFGYDHEKDSDARIMEDLEEKVWNDLQKRLAG